MKKQILVYPDYLFLLERGRQNIHCLSTPSSFFLANLNPYIKKLVFHFSAPLFICHFLLSIKIIKEKIKNKYEMKLNIWLYLLGGCLYCFCCTRPSNTN